MTDRSGSQIDHLNIAVPDLPRARAFYDPLLAVLGIHPILDIPATATDAAMTGYGWPDAKPFFWLIDDGIVGTNMHIAFTADDRDQVYAFYDTATELGAQLLHPPGHPPRIPRALLRRLRPRPPRHQHRGRLPPPTDRVTSPLAVSASDGWAGRGQR